MSSLLSSQGVVLAAAMVVSSTVLFLAFSKQKTSTHQLSISKNQDSDQSPNEKLRSCLCSEGKKKEKKKKRVQFAENVKDTKGNGDEYRREKEKSLFGRQDNKGNSNTRIDRFCRNEIPRIHRMPANRIALYNGILRDRVHRMQCSY